MISRFPKPSRTAAAVNVTISTERMHARPRHSVKLPGHEALSVKCPDMSTCSERDGEHARIICILCEDCANNWIIIDILGDNKEIPAKFPENFM